MIHYSLFSEVDFYTTTAHEGNMALHTGDNIQTILENRKHVCQMVQVPFDYLTCHQAIHGTHLVHVTEDLIGKGSSSHDDALIACDAMYTKLKGVPLMVFHADCVPILFYDRKKGIVGAIHAGYMGVANGIVNEVFSYLVRYENMSIEDTVVYIGPSISQKNFELDKEKAFWFNETCILEEKQKYYVDLRKQIQLYLEQLGVKQMIINQRCTMNDLELYSYRQNKTISRHGSIVVLR